MPADPEDAPSHTGVAGENSSFPSPSSSTDVPAGLNTDTDASANQGPLSPRIPHYYDHVIIIAVLDLSTALLLFPLDLFSVSLDLFPAPVNHDNNERRAKESMM